MECDVAEGMLGGILGEEDQKPEIEASGTFAGADAFAAAVAAKLAGSDPEVARDTSVFLKQQAQILETQNQHLKEEHEARLHYLRGQAREVDIRRFGLRLRVGFQLFIALVATVIGVGVAIMIHDAVTSRRVVIEPFHTPPTLLANGIDGSVVAAGLLHEISHLQAATRSTAVRGRLAAESGDVELAANEMEAFGNGYADPIVRFNYPGQDCWIAPAEEAAGRRNKADAVLKAGGTFVNCYRFRADILDGRGDWAGAQRAYAEAAALAPDLPAGYFSWGVALAKHGDLAGAVAKLQDANKRGPRWADPLKFWGDVLVKQGNSKDALAKYDEALKYAPNWRDLRAAREALTKHAG